MRQQMTLKEFTAALAEKRVRLRVTAHGTIRGANERNLCPIQIIYAGQNGCAPSVWTAAKLLGLSAEDAAMIVEAADTPLCNLPDYLKKVRHELLHFVGSRQ